MGTAASDKTESDKRQRKPAKFIARMKLTKSSVASARPTTELSPKGRPCSKFFFDTEQPGFGLAVSAKGTKSFFVMRRCGNRQERFVFGYPHEMSVDDARTKAALLWAQMRQGISPSGEKRKSEKAKDKQIEAEGLTLKDAMTLYEGTLRAKGRTERTIEDYRYLLEKYLSAWLDRPLAELTRTDLRQRHVDIAKEIARGEHTAEKEKKGRGKHARPRGDGFGFHTANATMRAFRAVYNRALREHADLPANPTINVDWNREQRRTTRIPSTGLKEWYEGVTAISNPVRRDLLLFTLFTGLRRTNAAEPRWEDVDFDRKALHVPKPKSQRPFDLPLSNYLVDLLKSRKKENEKIAPDSPWVFPSIRGDGHLVDVRMQGGATRTKEKAKRSKKGEQIVPPEARYAPHDLRRTFISVAESVGISREARQLLVNHATPKNDLHGGYVIHELDDLRKHMEHISTRLLALCQPTPPSKQAKGNVVPIRGKKSVKAAA